EREIVAGRERDVDLTVADLAVGVPDRERSGGTRRGERDGGAADLEERGRDAHGLTRQSRHQLAPRVELVRRGFALLSDTVIPKCERRPRAPVEESDALGVHRREIEARVVAREEQRCEVDLELAGIRRVETRGELAQIEVGIEIFYTSDGAHLVRTRGIR